MGRPPKYLRLEEIEPQWREYYDFTSQQMYPRPNGRRGDLRIKAICPVCGKERWTYVSSVRNLSKTPRCHLCAVTGTEAYQWAGGRHKNEEGYVRIHLATLSATERLLAEPMTGYGNYLLEHRWVMAKHLGRPLTEDEVVHHRNGIKDDNHLSNLQLLTKQTHVSTWGDPYYQKWQEALAENERLKEQLRAIQEG